MKIKVVLLFLLAFYSVNTQAQQIEWMSLAEAIEAQKIAPKKIFMDVYTDWCGPFSIADSRNIIRSLPLKVNFIFFS